MIFLIPYFAGLVTLILGDLIWLGVLMRSFYQSQLGHLLSPTVNWTAAVVFYLVYTAGILIFAVVPNMSKGLSSILLYSALFGAIAYATYDLTNQATMRNWPVSVTILDILWGAFLSLCVGFIMYKVANYFSH